MELLLWIIVDSSIYLRYGSETWPTTKRLVRAGRKILCLIQRFNLEDRISSENTIACSGLCSCSVEISLVEHHSHCSLDMSKSMKT